MDYNRDRRFLPYFTQEIGNKVAIAYRDNCCANLVICFIYVTVIGNKF